MGVNNAAQSAANIVKGRHEPILALGTYFGSSQALESALSEPPRDTRNRLPHFIGRTRIAKADELTASNRIEIDAGCRRDMCLLQHFLRKLETVGRECRDIRVQVKRAIGGQEIVEARLRQGPHQDAGGVPPGGGFPPPFPSALFSSLLPPLCLD